jgi:hypothetical protein
VITPPLGLELCGYGPYLGRRGTAVHQDLHCTALALSDGNAAYALVSNDLIWLDRWLVEEIHRRIHAATGLDPARVIITNTHTHSGPATMTTVAWGEPDEAYVRTLPGLIAEAVERAVRGMQPGRIGFGRVDIPELSVNRVEQDGPVDREALLFRIDDADGTMRAAGINFSAHPVTLGASPLICGDYPGDGIAKMERALNGKANILFFQGSCGNLNCRGFGAGLETLDANGTLLKDCVLPALDAIQTVPEVTLAGDTVEMPLPMQVPDREALMRDIAAYEEQIAAFTGDKDTREYRQMRFERDWRKVRLDLLDRPHPGRLELRVAYLRINDAVLAAHPLELFLEYGNEIKAASPYPHTFLVGYANEAVGYLARPQDFSLQGFGHYAAVFAPRICRHLEFQPDAGAVFRDHVLALLHRIKEKE